MSFVKIAAMNLAFILVLVASFDTLAYLGFRDEIEMEVAHFGEPDALERGYPRYYFERHEERGFDITPSIRTISKRQPVEGSPYPVWGNRFGCFDTEWTIDTTNAPDKPIYLAGDSYTWGYAPFEAKFGTLLEADLNREVLSCGVTHTGQRHQFSKFVELFDKGIRPEIVIVNISYNDEANDFFYPHSTVIDGYLVDDVDWCVEGQNRTLGDITSADIRTSRAKHSELLRKLDAARDVSPIDLASAYSLSFNLLDLGKNLVLHRIQRWLGIERQKPATCPNTLHSVYGSGRYTVHNMLTTQQAYRDSDLSLPNRQIIRRWVEHANKNGYRILFTTIPAPNPTPEEDRLRDEKLEFIRSLSADVADFDDYIELHYSDNRSSLFYQRDQHLSELGNRVYADFLADSIHALLDGHS